MLMAWWGTMEPGRARWGLMGHHGTWSGMVGPECASEWPQLVPAGPGIWPLLPGCGVMHGLLFCAWAFGSGFGRSLGVGSCLHEYCLLPAVMCQLSGRDFLGAYLGTGISVLHSDNNSQFPPGRQEALLEISKHFFFTHATSQQFSF